MSKKFSLSLTNQILLATVIGLILGAVVGPQIEPIGSLGTIFLNLVMMGVPIVILGAVTEAVGQLSPSQLGKMGARLFTMFFLSTVIAAVIGVFFALVIQPGVGVNVEAANVNISGHGKSFTDIITSFFPKNIISALSRGDMMQVIIFALFFGVATSVYLDKTGDDKVLEFVKSLNKTILILIGFVMKIAPIGVGALMAKVAGATGLAVLLPLAKYLFTLFIATALIMLIYVLITAFYVKVSPIKLTQKVIPMSIMAATTTSSAMSLPIKMKDSEEKLGVSHRISNLVNPLGMVLNSAGQAVFLSIASIFIIQIYNIDIPFTGIIQIVALSTLACMGTLSVPGGALVIFASLMPSLGLPAEGVAFIAGIDWFRGMITTIPNVTGDALIATIIAKQEGEFNRDIFDGKVVHVKEDV
ncbi:dicarboxylate/amino acid:cation symporter [Pasteurellaceae bacterium 22721_9_1]